MTTQVLVVDDVPAMAEQYAYDLKRVGGYSTIVAMKAQAAAASQTSTGEPRAAAAPISGSPLA